jgi:hypothetical protein
VSHIRISDPTTTCRAREQTTAAQIMRANSSSRNGMMTRRRLQVDRPKEMNRANIGFFRHFKRVDQLE